MNKCEFGKCFDHWLNKFYCKQLSIDILDCVKSHKEKDTDPNNPPNEMVITEKLQNDFQHNKNEIGETYVDLIKSGYLIRSSQGTPNFDLSLCGEKFLEDYYRFKMKGMLAKFTQIFKENLISIVAILALIISLFKI